MKITFIIGLPCSGKSWLANKLSLGIIPIVDDDFEDTSFIQLLTKRYFSKNNPGYILTYPGLCEKRILDEELEFVNTCFDKHNPILEFIYFENNPLKCMKNLEHRMRSGDRRNVELTIKTLTTKYFIPQNIIPLPIWTKS